MDFAKANEIATGAPGTIKIGETVWLVSQPTAADLLALRDYVRKRLPTPLQAIKHQIADLDPELQAVAIRAAVELQASGSGLTADKIQEQLATPEVCGWWVWMLARKEQPWATPDTFRSAITADNVHAVLADLFEAARMSGLEKNSQAGLPGS